MDETLRDRFVALDVEIPHAAVGANDWPVAQATVLKSHIEEWTPRATVIAPNGPRKIVADLALKFAIRRRL